MKLQLPCPIVPLARRADVAARLRCSEAELLAFLRGQRAWRDDALWSEPEFTARFAPARFEDHCGADALPSECTAREFELARDPRRTLPAPIAARDVVAADLLALCLQLQRIQDEMAPRSQELRVMTAIQTLCDEPERDVRWQPISELWLGEPPARGACGAPPRGEPLWELAAPYDSLAVARAPRDCALLDAGLLVQFDFATLCLSADGHLLDVVPSFDLRLIGGHGPQVLFTGGGGATSSTGHFDGQAYVRDVRERRWCDGPLDPGLPQHLAGTAPELQWPLVLDPRRGVGYRTRPRHLVAQRGGVGLSACGRYLWDGSRFVRELASGEAVCDAGELPGEPLAFARRAEGFLFVLLEAPRAPDDEPQLRVRDAGGTLRCALGAFDGLSAWAFSADGTRLVHATATSLRVLDALDATPTSLRLDLRPLQTALALPEDSVLWRRLTAAVAVPCEVAQLPLATARQLSAGPWSAAASDRELEAAKALAADWPPLPSSLPSAAQA